MPAIVALAELVTKEQDPEAARVAAFMGMHERAILAATGAAASGGGDPVAPMAKLLRYPLARP